MNVDRRREIRVPLQLRVEYGGFGDKTYHSYTEDLNTHGMCLRSNGEFGTACRFLLALPHHKEKTAVTGEVCWRTFEPAPGRMGIRFSQPIDLSVPPAAADKALHRFREQAAALRDEKHQLEQITEILQCSVPGRVVLLNRDLSIASINGFEETLQKGGPKISFIGMDFRKATELVGVKVKGRRLWDELQLCAKTGQEFVSDPCHYQGSAGDRPDLFSPGTFRIGISPILDLDRDVASLLMLVKIEAPLGLHGQQDERALDHFPHILRGAATGLLLKDILEESCHPFTYLLARMNLLRYKFELETAESQSTNGDQLDYYAGEIQKIEAVIEDLSKRFKYVVQNTCSPEPEEPHHHDINESLSKAISIVSMYKEFDDETIRFDPQPELSKIKSGEQESIMIFVIFLLLSRDCVATVSDKTIHCETTQDQRHVIAGMRHNGYIRQDKYLNILFDSDPLESYFSKSHSTYFMDTLLYYGNLLLKKNNMKIKINNVPGEFSLSVYVPKL